MGYAGNVEPQYIVPTVVAQSGSASSQGVAEGLNDMDFYIGNEVSDENLAFIF